MDNNNILMKMINKKLFGIFGTFLLFIVLLSLNIDAVGVSAPHWDERPLYVRPGEVKEITYLLQNMIGDSGIKMKAELEGDTSIISFIDTYNIYDVPIGTSDKPVRVKITTPSDAQQGQEWQVGVRFSTILAEEEGKAVAIGTAFSKGFRVIVSQEPQPVLPTQPTPIPQPIEEERPSSFSLILVLLVILIVLFLIVRKVLKKKEGQPK